MAKKTLKSAADAAEEQLKAGAKLLQAQLATGVEVAEKLAANVKDRLPAPAEVTALAKDAVAKRGGRGKKQAPAPAKSAAETPAKTAAKASGGKTVDSSWTVADLRAEAKRRGLTGYSGKNKSQLLRQLRG